MLIILYRSVTVPCLTYLQPALKAYLCLLCPLESVVALITGSPLAYGFYRCFSGLRLSPDERPCMLLVACFGSSFIPASCDEADVNRDKITGMRETTTTSAYSPKAFMP